jgi:CDGSH-type Zn-finger protein
VDGAEDMPGVNFRAALCRCGQSKNKPFCDNSHEEAGFKDYGALGDQGEGFDAPGGTLKVSRAPNGPLLLNGNFTIVAASGRRAWSGTKAALCRCGHSTNKPFCDGAHKAAAFQAD